MTYLAIATAVTYILYSIVFFDWKRRVLYPARDEAVVALGAILESLLVVLLVWVIFFR